MLVDMTEEIERTGLLARLAQIDVERASLTKRLNELKVLPAISGLEAARSVTISAASKAAEKIALFRRMFAGRTDVFPVRWDNPRTERSGYAPACTNEWVRGVCNKPQVKCSECPNQAFIAVSDKVIASHLRGKDSARPRDPEFVAGVYPVLVDDTCWFLENALFGKRAR